MYSWPKHYPSNFIIPLGYLVVGLLWINLSDSFMYWLKSILHWSTGTLEHFSILKGYFYVVVTTLLLYLFIHVQMKSLVRTKNDFINVFANNTNSMWIYETLSQRILLANNSACVEFGYSELEFRSLKLQDLLSDKIKIFTKNTPKAISENLY